jgi:hypothetical protein
MEVKDVALKANKSRKTVSTLFKLTKKSQERRWLNNPQVKKEKNDDDEFDLFMTKFKAHLKIEVLHINSSKFNKRKPIRACCHYGKYDHFISNCPYEMRSDKDKDRHKD